VIYAFGQQWGPETKKRDKYFRFLPGSGIHDIHMNQGNDGKYKKDNGAYQDGALVFAWRFSSRFNRRHLTLMPMAILRLAVMERSR
jgi:uncharacterized protein YukJ